MAGLREVGLASVFDALIAATDREAGRLRKTIESDNASPEERFRALTEFARLSMSLVSIWANHEAEIPVLN